MDTWNTIKTWDMVMPPSRPDKWQLDVISDILVKKDKTCLVAVLGSTVEFRDLLFELGIKNVIIFEKNHDYYRETFEHKVYHVTDEKVVWGDWLSTLSKYNNTFDIILSDLTSGNIPYVSRRAFYENISNSLVVDGLFVDRILTKQIALHDINNLINKYSKLPVNIGTVNKFNCEMLFCSKYQEESKTVNTSAIYDNLLSYNIPKINLFVKKCYRITPRECIWWYGKDWDVEVKPYIKHLNILHEFDEPIDSAYYGRCKLFINSGV